MSAGLNKHVGEQFSHKLINMQVLIKSMQVGIFQKINKICCTFIKDARVLGHVPQRAAKLHDVKFSVFIKFYSLAFFGL